MLAEVVLQHHIFFFCLILFNSNLITLSIKVFDDEIFFGLRAGTLQLNFSQIFAIFFESVETIMSFINFDC